MVANTIPIFTNVPSIANDSAAGIVANTTKDLTAGTIYLVYTADVTDGSFVQKLRVRPKGTNVATVMRVFLNNGLTTATLANNMLYDEITLPATTNSEVAALLGYDVPMNIALPPGWRIYVTFGTIVAGGFAVTTVAGNY